jgi:hypothetical protein
MQWQRKKSRLLLFRPCYIIFWFLYVLTAFSYPTRLSDHSRSGVVHFTASRIYLPSLLFAPFGAGI